MSETEIDKVMADAATYGVGVQKDGKHIPHKDFIASDTPRTDAVMNQPWEGNKEVVYNQFPAMVDLARQLERELIKMRQAFMSCSTDEENKLREQLSAAQEANHQLKLAFDDLVRVIRLQLKDKEELQKRIGELEDEIKRLYRHSLLSGE